MADESLNLRPQLTTALTDLCLSERCAELSRLDSYGRSTQYAGRRYDWDGRMTGYGEQADIAPGWYVPYRLRRPKARLDLPKLIVQRLTAFTLGSERFPEIHVDGDPDAEDYVRTLCRESRLPAKMLEARNKGGMCGTAVVSFKFTDGKPRVLVHEARTIHVLRWHDKDEHVIGAVLKCYPYQRQVWVNGKPKTLTFYYARYWDEQMEIVWDPIQEDDAKRADWASRVTSYRVTHGFGECPVYWVQNYPDSEHEDGLSDYDGLCDQFDEVNEVLSATTTGTKANVDPTLVVKDDPGNNPGALRKGSGNAIYAKGGAEYLELSGAAVEAGLQVVDRLAQMCLDLAGVVVADPKDIASKATSGAALKLLYEPMIATCDVLRSQYSELIVRVLRGMLRAAKMVGSMEPMPGPDEQAGTTADGQLLQHQPTIVLPPRFEASPDSDDQTKLVPVERTPGESEYITLVWPDYFAMTPADAQAMVTTVTQAKGQLISTETAVKAMADYFGVTDVKQELAAIQLDQEEALRQQMEAFPPPDPAATDENEE